MDALRQANRIRTLRARLKRDLRAGKRTIAPLLEDPPTWLRSAKVWDFILTVPKVGRSRAERTFAQCAVSHTKTFAGLTARQRIEMAKLMRTRS